MGSNKIAANGNNHTCAAAIYRQRPFKGI